MYLTWLKIEHLKLIEKIELDFTRDGRWRQWTVLIGRNGRCKTAILQAIALAAAGGRDADRLGEALVLSYRPRREETNGAPPPTRIHCDFTLEPPAARGAKRRKYPSTPRIRALPGRGQQGGNPVKVSSELILPPEKDVFEARSWFEGESPEADPLGAAREQALPYWFVAGYGVSRRLRFNTSRPEVPGKAQLQRERLSTLFDPDVELLGLGFADRFDDSLIRIFARFVQALTTNAKRLLPELGGVELAGRSGVRRAADLLERERVIQALPSGTRRKLPATWLSHGYQSSLSWLSDLLGHALIEDPAFADYRRGEKVALDEIQGLVLIDELDLHIHPSWQRTFVRALAETFPAVQFVATTHSPLLLSALRPDEVVALELDERDLVRRREIGADPRLLTGSELYEELFETQSLPAQELGQVLDDYRFWARNPNRSAARDRDVLRWRRTLEAEGITPPFETVPRGGETA